MPIWAYGHMGICEKNGQVGYPLRKHQKCNKIWTSFSRLDRGLVQKAKWSEIFRRSRIQAVPTISNNLCPKCLGLIYIYTQIYIGISYFTEILRIRLRRPKMIGHETDTIYINRSLTTQCAQ